MDLGGGGEVKEGVGKQSREPKHKLGLDTGHTIPLGLEQAGSLPLSCARAHMHTLQANPFIYHFGEG